MLDAIIYVILFVTGMAVAVGVGFWRILKELWRIILAHPMVTILCIALIVILTCVIFSAWHKFFEGDTNDGKTEKALN